MDRHTYTNISTNTHGELLHIYIGTQNEATANIGVSLKMNISRVYIHSHRTWAYMLECCFIAIDAADGVTVSHSPLRFLGVFYYCYMVVVYETS